MIINGLNFERSKKHYDVYNIFKDGKQVGHARLRYGYLRCEYPCFNGREIYSAKIGDGWGCEFQTEEERTEHLNAIADVILKIVKKG